MGYFRMIFNCLMLNALCMLKIDSLYSCPEQMYLTHEENTTIDESQKNICVQRVYCYET